MKTFSLPALWDAKKFAARYSLNLHTDFYIDGEGMLVVFPDLRDDPPVFDLPDPPKPAISVRLDGVTDLPSLIIILKEVLR